MTAATTLTVRQLEWSFPLDGPHDWMAGSPVLSRLLDVFTLLVPDNERYYVRTLGRCIDRLRDDDQRLLLQQFFRQETSHGRGHAAYWSNLEASGLPIRRFVKIVGRLLYGASERLTPHRVHVAIVAANEHINAYLGHIALSKGLLDGADPRLRRLFEWHFAEEIEHKAVAHDVLATVYPGYATRIAGALVAFPLFHAVIFWGAAWMLARERQLWRRKTLSDLYGFFIKRGVLRDMLKHMARYLAPGFQPWRLDDRALAERFFATTGGPDESAEASA